MKTLMLLLLPAAIFAQCNINQHLSNANVDVYVGMVQSQPPQVPGAPASRCRVALSISTTDMDTVGFAINFEVRLADGSFSVIIRKSVDRVTILGERTIVEASISYFLPPVVAIDRLDVARLHAMPLDTLFCSRCQN